MYHLRTLLRINGTAHVCPACPSASALSQSMGFSVCGCCDCLGNDCGHPFACWDPLSLSLLRPSIVLAINSTVLLFLSISSSNLFVYLILSYIVVLNLTYIVIFEKLNLKLIYENSS